MDDERTYTAFAGDRQIAAGKPEEFLRQIVAHRDRTGGEPILVFDDHTGRQLDLDLRGSLAEILERLAPPRPRAGPGRPRLGVVAREVSLLPRHWEWLEQQPNGASAALRRLVEDARRSEPEQALARRAAEAADRFMAATAGDRPGFEEATRALYAGNRRNFLALTGDWPPDIRAHAARLAQAAFPEGALDPPAGS